VGGGGRNPGGMGDRKSTGSEKRRLGIMIPKVVEIRRNRNKIHSIA